jgi:UDP-3-O-[3-hydroxymyristoyl] glucosamine N-acyltransferase
VVLHDHPRAAVAQLLESLHREAPTAPGVDPTAAVDPSAVLGRDVGVGPFAVIGPEVTLADDVVVRERVSIRAGCHVGARTELHPGVVLYPRVTLGVDCCIHANAVIGADGFGYTAGRASHLKIPHVGGVVIGDRVEVGASTCIDGGMLDPTRIGDDTKIDNLVQVGHNCRIGQRVLLCGQVGIAGSSEIGDDSVLAGQVGVSDHVTIGAGSMAGAASSVLGSLPARSVVGGTPAHDFKAWRRESKALKSLPELVKTVRELRRRIQELERDA